MPEIVTELTIDASGASQGAQAYVRSMDLAEAASEKLVDQTRKVGQAIDQQSATMTRIVGTAGNAARAFERLRNSADPAARAQSAMERATRTVDRALQQGVTTGEEAARVLDLLRQKYATAEAAAGSWAAGVTRSSVALQDWPGNAAAATRGLEGVAEGSRAAGAGMSNMVFQLQDVGQGLLSGQSTMQLVTQQGFQMAYAFEQAGGSLKAVGAALKSLVSPTNLIVIGVIALASVVTSWLTGMKSKTDEATDAVDRHADAIQELERRYKAAADGAEQLTQAELNRLLLSKRQELSALEAVRITIADVQNQIDDVFDWRQRLDPANQAVTDAIDNFSNFRTDVIGLADELTRVANQNPALRDLAVQILAIVQPLADSKTEAMGLQDEIAQLEADLANLGQTITTRLSRNALGDLLSGIRDQVGQVDDAVASGLTQTLQASLTRSLEQANDAVYGEIAALQDTLTAAMSDAFSDPAIGQDFARAVMELLNSFDQGTPDVIAFQEAISRLRNLDPENVALRALADALLADTQRAYELQQGANAASGALKTLKNPAHDAAGGIGELNTAMADFMSTDFSGMTKDAVYALYALAIAAAKGAEQIAAVKEHFQSALNMLTHPKHEVTTPPGSGGGAAAPDAFEQTTASIESQIEALQLDIATFGMAEDAAKLFRIEQELLNAAMETGGVVTAEERAQIDDLIARYAAGQAELKALQAEGNQGWIEAKDYAESFTQTLVAGLESGKDALQAVGDAVSSLSQQLAQKAVKDLFSGNFAKAAIEGIVAIFTFFIGRIIAARRELKKAQDDWAAMADDVANFTATLNGQEGGGLASALKQATDQTKQYVEAAKKAGASTDDLTDALAAFTGRQIRQFIGDFGVMLDALNEGLGENSPAVAAAKNVETIGEALRGFVGDTRTAVEITGADPAAIGAAQRAAQGYALSLLDTAPELSEVEKRLRELQGTAANLQGLLEDLGMSASEAGRAVQDGFNRALDDLRQTFAGDLTAKIYGAEGKGYLNDIADLIQEGASLLNDATLLGTGRTDVGRYFVAQAQSIVDGAGLAGDAFDELIALFPDLAGVVHEASDAVAESLSKINDAASSILNFLRDRLAGSQSTLSPTDRFAAAGTLYRSQLALAQSGDVAAQQGIGGFAGDFLDAARGMFASSEDYQRLFDEVTHALASLPTVQQAADPVVQQLKGAIGAILGVETSVTDAGATTTGAVEDVGENTSAALDLLEAVRNVQTSTEQVSNTISQSILKLGSVTENINIALADNYFGPMTGYLEQIAAYTQKMSEADKRELKFPLLARLFPRLFGNIYKEAGGLIPSLPQQGPALVGGYAGGGLIGGLIGNGIYNRDSVVARLAGGGSVMLAGGEFVTRATSVNPATYAALDHINRTGRRPDNDNQRQNFVDLMRTFQSGTNASVIALQAGFERLAEKLDRLEKAIEREGRRKSDRKQPTRAA